MQKLISLLIISSCLLLISCSSETWRYVKNTKMRDYERFRYKDQQNLVFRNTMKDWMDRTWTTEGKIPTYYEITSKKQLGPEHQILMRGKGCFKENEVDERPIVTSREDELYGAIYYLYKMNSAIDVELTKSEDYQGLSVQANDSAVFEVELAYCVDPVITMGTWNKHLVSVRLKRNLSANNGE